MQRTPQQEELTAANLRVQVWPFQSATQNRYGFSPEIVGHVIQNQNYGNMGREPAIEGNQVNWGRIGHMPMGKRGPRGDGKQVAWYSL